jgi:hypothetical protein
MSTTSSTTSVVPGASWQVAGEYQRTQSDTIRMSFYTPIVQMISCGDLNAFNQRSLTLVRANWH